MFILENDFLGPLSTSLGYVLYYLCILFTGISYFFFGVGTLTTTSSYYSQSYSSSEDDLGFSFFFFFLSFAAFFSSFAYFLSFFLGYSSKESSYDSYYSDSIFFFPLLFFSGIITSSSCFLAYFTSFNYQSVLGLSNLAIQLDLPVGACYTGLETIGLATLLLILLILASTFGLADFLLWSNDCLRVVTPCSGQIRF